jgi:peptidyl-prolyl cis-trans isomerase D
MLDALRRGATSWVAKIFLGLLVLSFAVWGVADVFRGYNEGALAEVGDRQITSDEFQRALQLELAMLGRQIGRRPTMEQARAFGIDTRVLSRLIGAAALDSHAEELRLSITDEAVAEEIRNDPSFKNPDGSFNRMALESVARELGLSEYGFLALRKKEEIRQQLTDAITAGAYVPDTLVKALYDYRNEARNVEHFTIDPNVAIKLPEPDPAKLKELYESEKQRFMTPEYRKLAVIGLTMEEMKKRVPITDAELSAAYEQDKARYEVPERRRVLQIAFKTPEEAEQAAAAIRGGKSFEDVAKEAGIAESDYTLGLLSRDELIDPAVAEAAFSLENGAVSDVVRGRFAPVLVKVTEIQPGKQRTLDEVKDQVRDTLAADKAGPELNRLHDEIDDRRFAGKPLKEIAQELDLPFLEIEATDKTGKAPDGSVVVKGPDADRILKAAFEGQVGFDGDSIELADGGYGWVNVISVTEAKQRTFEEAEADVAALWRERETRRMLSELGSQLAERAGKGESMEALAQEVGGKVETARNVKRIGGAPGLPDGAVGQAFITARDAAGSAETRDGKSRVVFKVTEVIPPPAATKEELDRLRSELERQVEGDLLSGYLGGLQDRLGVSINQAAYLRAVGASPEQQ